MTDQMHPHGYRVTGTHPHPDYAALLSPFQLFTAGARGESDYRVQCDRHGGTYYATARLMGCGKDYATPEAAIIGLLEAEGFTGLKVEPAPAPTPPEAPTEGELAAALFTLATQADEDTPSEARTRHFREALADAFDLVERAKRTCAARMAAAKLERFAPQLLEELKALVEYADRQDDRMEPPATPVAEAMQLLAEIERATA